MQPGDLDALLDCEWLCRAWTFQEVLLASNPVLVRGRKVIAWNTLYAGLRVLLSRRVGFKLGFLPPNRLTDTFLSHDRTAYAALPSVQTWLDVFSTWLSLYRPISWNGVLDRSLLPPEWFVRRTDYEDGGMTVQAYHEWVITSHQVIQLAMFAWIGIYAFLALAFVVACGVVVAKMAGNTGAAVLGAVAAVFLALAVVVGIDLHIMRLRLEASLADGSDHGQTRAVVSVLRAIREREATVAEDRAYATHGVLGSLSVALSPPDYTHSLGQVYLDFFRDLLAWRPTMVNLLVDVGGDPLPNAPSWVPDWSTLAERAWLPSENIYGFVEKMHWAPSVSLSGSEMIIRAVAVGRITFASGPIDACTCGEAGHGNSQAASTSVLCPLPSSLSALSRWLTAIEQGAPSGETYQSIPKAVYNALSGCTSEPTNSESDAFGQWYRISANTHAASTAQPSSGDAQAQMLLASLGQATDALAFATRCAIQLAGRREVFFSLDGHIGTGPPRTAEDDMIFILNGVDMPMILRETGTEPGRYTVLGPAFVCGLTDLAGYEPKSGNRGWEDIILT
jgi:hypothetical protein